MQRIVVMSLGGSLAWIAFILANLCALGEHIIVCIQQHELFLLIIGVVLPFVGVIHGWGLWFGLFTS